MMNRFVAIFAGVGLVATALLSGGCAKSEPPPPPPPVEKRPPAPSLTENWTAEQIAFFDEKFGKLEVTPSGLRYKILQPGTGEATPSRANLVTVHYRGELQSGQVFDDSRKRGRPFPFRVGVGHVVKGWDEALLTMKKGEKRLVIVPFWLGYGVNGKVPIIPPRAPMVFEIELLDWESTVGIPKAQNP
jgi:FKBP-type peptidyl-prolyl cis-trans isomerase